MNIIEKLADAKDWKDRAAGWKRWRIRIAKCLECGATNTSYTLHGTREDAERFARDPKQDCCEACS